MTYVDEATSQLLPSWLAPPILAWSQSPQWSSKRTAIFSDWTESGGLAAKKNGSISPLLLPQWLEFPSLGAPPTWIGPGSHWNRRRNHWRPIQPCWPNRNMTLLPHLSIDPKSGNPRTLVAWNTASSYNLIGKHIAQHVFFYAGYEVFSYFRRKAKFWTTHSRFLQFFMGLPTFDYRSSSSLLNWRFEVLLPLKCQTRS